MKTVKKYTTGKLKGYNIRQYKNGIYHIYIGTVCQTLTGFTKLVYALEAISATQSSTFDLSNN